MGMTVELGLEAATRLWSAELTQKKRWRAFPRNSWRHGSWGSMPASHCAMRALIRARVQRAFGDACLEDLAVPLRVVTTDSDDGRISGAQQRRVTDAGLAAAWRCHSSSRACRSPVGASAMA
jgi:NTE family protein